MKIGISGASGKYGGAVIRELRQRPGSAAPVAISRTPASLPDDLERRHGDYDLPETLARAYAGLDRLLIIPSSAMAPGVRARQNVAAIDAAVAAQVGQIVFTSAAGTRQVDEPHLLASYYAAEQHLMRHARNWTILRNNYYAESLAEEAMMSLGAEALFGIEESKVAFVSRDDLAAAAAALLAQGGHAGAIYNLTGPERLSGSERAAAIAEAAGTACEFRALPEAQYRAALTTAGLPNEYLEPMVAIQQSFAAGTFDILTGDVERLSGRPPRPLAEVLRPIFAQQR